MAAALNPTRGSRHHMAKFTEDEIALILNLVNERDALKKAASELTNAKIAEKFEVHPRTIEKIISGETWAHV